MKSAHLKYLAAAAVFALIAVPHRLGAQKQDGEGAVTATPNPLPLINLPLVPGAIKPGSISLTLTVNGTGFVAGSVVKWNGSPRATKFVTNSKLTASIPSTDVVKAGTASVTVVNPVPGGGTSNVAFVEVTKPTTAIAVSTSSIPTPVGPISLAAGDFNRDGKQDLVVTSSGSNRIGVLIGNGDGTFKPPVQYDAGNGPQSVAVGDFNSDGKLDVAVANYSGTVSILLGNGDGTFQGPANYATGNASSSVAVGDFNRDGKLDLVVTNSGAANGVSSVSVLLGNGDGTFRAATNYSAGLGAYSVAVGDFNRDGKLDLAVASFGSGTVSILLGKGDGTFQTGPSYATGGPTSVAVGDFNGDGILDFVVANLGSNQGFGTLSAFLGAGDGTFHLAGNFGVGSNPYAVAVGDFSGDGTLDLAVANYGGYGNAPSVSILLGNGNGTFQPAFDYSVESGPYGPSSLAVGDFNRGGRLGLAIGDGASGASAITVLLQPPLVTGPDVILDPAGLVFSTQLVGTTSAAQPVLLANYGTSTLTISSIKKSGDFNLTNACGSTLAAGAACIITMAFDPTQGGTRIGTVSVTDDAPGSPQTLHLTGTGTVVELSPTSLAFGCHTMCVGPLGCRCYCTRPQTTTLTNVGHTVLDISGLTISGPFSETSTCGTTLGAGNSCSVDVTWSRVSGNGRVSVTDNGGGSPQTVSLSAVKQCSP